MAYDYIKTIYGVVPVIGATVRHTVTGKTGTIVRESGSHSHYVRVKFEGNRCASLCHPTELDYSADT